MPIQVSLPRSAASLQYLTTVCYCSRAVGILNLPLLITLRSTHQSPSTVNKKASELVIGTVKLSSEIICQQIDIRQYAYSCRIFLPLSENIPILLFSPENQLLSLPHLRPHQLASRRHYRVTQAQEHRNLKNQDVHHRTQQNIEIVASPAFPINRKNHTLPVRLITSGIAYRGFLSRSITPKKAPYTLDFNQLFFTDGESRMG